MTGRSGRRYGDQGYDNGQAYRDHDYDDGQAYGDQGYDGHAYDGYDHHGNRHNGHNGYGGNGQAYPAQGENGQAYSEHQAYNGQWYDNQAYEGQGYGPAGYEDQPTRQYGGYADQAAPQYGGFEDQPTRQYDGYNGYNGYDGYDGYDGQPARQDSYRDPRGVQGQGYDGQGHDAQWYDSQGYAVFNGHPGQEGYAGQEYGTGPGRPGQRPRQGQGSLGLSPRRTAARDAGPGAPDQRAVHFRRLRRLSHRRSVRVAAAIFGVFLVWVMFSAGQASFKNNGQGFAANLAEWARDHYLGPIVTLGEWLTYNPPKSGGKPSFSYAVPKGEQVTATKGRHKGFVPDVPPTVKLLATGPALPGEGQWRVVEKVKGEPAILITFLRDGGQYTSYSNGIASIDQRLVKFSLRPGTEDPGSAPGGGNWGVPDYIPAGQRTGVLATFNGGFKLDAAGGGFYLNGMYHGSLVNGAASIVYYKNGAIKIGAWGRDFSMNSRIQGVRQNLSLLVDHGQVSPNANSAVKTSNWGATLGGGYWVWRSGIGITRDGRIIFVYGQALDAQDLGKLLKQAGAIEGMQMDINPEWMKFDYYQADGHPSDPTPVPLLPNQQANPYSYYTPSTRDFTAVYAR